MTERIKFTVYRDKWLRGQGGFNSELLACDGSRCCLGHLARDLGYLDDEIASVASPPGVNDRSLWPGFLLSDGRGMSSAEGAGLMSVNDDPNLSDDRREAILTKRFAANGIDVTFADGPGPEVA